MIIVLEELRRHISRIINIIMPLTSAECNSVWAAHRVRTRFSIEGLQGGAVTRTPCYALSKPRISDFEMKFGHPNLD